jgi:hypothetical protein
LRLDSLVKYLGASSKDCTGSLSSILFTMLGTRLLLDRAVGRTAFSFLSLPLPRLIGLGVGSTCSAGDSSICSAVGSSILSAVGSPGSICSTAACSVSSAGPG